MADIESALACMAHKLENREMKLLEKLSMLVRSVATIILVLLISLIVAIAVGGQIINEMIRWFMIMNA